MEPRSLLLALALLLPLAAAGAARADHDAYGAAMVVCSGSAPGAMGCSGASSAAVQHVHRWGVTFKTPSLMLAQGPGVRVELSGPLAAGGTGSFRVECDALDLLPVVWTSTLPRPAMHVSCMWAEFHVNFAGPVSISVALQGLTLAEYHVWYKGF